MSPQRLPEQIIPFKLARQRRLLQGVLKLDTMTRLTGLLADNCGNVDVDLQFDIDAQGISHMRGRLSAQVRLVCQRCMEPVAVSLATDIAVGFAASEERALTMPESYEAHVLAEETIVLSELIEDESCQPWFEKQQEELSGIEEVTEKKNPFAVLASLKQDS